MRRLAALLLACTSPAIAETPDGGDQGASPAEVTEAAGPGTLNSPLSLLNAIELNASEDGSNAAIRLGTAISDTGGRFHVLSVAAGAPLDKDTGSAFSALDPFANGVFLEGRYTFTQLFGRRADLEAAGGICEDVQRRTEVPMGGAGCSTPYIRANAPERLDEFERLFFDNPTVFFAGVNGRVGREGFEFLEAATGTRVEDTRTPWMIGGFVGVSHLPWRNAFSIDFRHQTRFKAARTGAVCPGTPGVTVCPVGPVGPPTEREQNIVGVEYRQRIGRQFAFSIRASYDVESEIFELDVPVYVVSDASTGLNAGVRLRYVDDPDEDELNEGLVFGIFVSKSFTLFR